MQESGGDSECCLAAAAALSADRVGFSMSRDEEKYPGGNEKCLDDVRGQRSD